MVDVLRERWPVIFAASDAELRPLAIGVFRDICIALDLAQTGRRTLRCVLARYTNRTAYHEVVIAGRERIGLDGSDAGAPDASHVEHARAALADKEARREAKAQAAASKAARIAAAVLRAQAKAEDKTALKPIPKPAPQPRATTERRVPTVEYKRRRRIAEVER
jgi:ProP effector